MNNNKKFAVLTGRFDSAVVGATVPRDLVPKNVTGFVPVHRFSTRREADARAKSMASFGAPWPGGDVLVVRKSGRRGWVVVELEVWED